MKRFGWRVIAGAVDSGGRAGRVLLAAVLLAAAVSALAFVLRGSVCGAEEPSEGSETPHLIEGHEACSACHGASGIRPAHGGRLRDHVEVCVACHRLAAPPQVPTEGPGGDAYCLNCHKDSAIAVQLADGQLLSLQVDATALRDSVHKGIGCTACHRDVGAYPHVPVDLSGVGAYRARAVRLCMQCHATIAVQYESSVHGKPLLAGTGRGAACFDCHSEERSGHSVRPVTGPEAFVLPWTLMPNCGRCHPEELDSYIETSHAKVVRFGNPLGAAICTTCHGAHNARPVNDPEAPLTPENLVSICRDCHAGATKSFAAGWVGHRGASATRFPIVYFTERFFIFLTAVTVALGILHVELDFFRWLSERGRDQRGDG